MIITNKLGLPQAFINALNNTRHNEKGEYSATTLLKGGCDVMLTDRHFDEIEIDVSEQVWQIFGSAVHAIFEKAGIEGFTEEKFSVNVGNSKVSGRVDLYDLENETVYDWKTASVWKTIYNDYDDWDKQGLIYSWLMKQNGLNVKEVVFVALLKDHSKSKARIDASYPQSPTVVHRVEVTEERLAEIENFIKLKVSEFESAEQFSDEELPPCSKDERWATDDKFAVMKEGRKTAIKLYDDEDSAEKFIDEQEKDKDKMSVEKRPGESKKCLDYCACREFCPFYKSINAVGD